MYGFSNFSVGYTPRPNIYTNIQVSSGSVSALEFWIVV